MNKAHWPWVKADSGLFFMKIIAFASHLLRGNQINNQEFYKYKMLFM